MLAETQYAKSGDIRIAYQVVGSGPLDLVWVPGFISNLEVYWEEPTLARLLSRLSSFCRVILFDKRGTGLSDRVGAMPTLEDRMDDVRAVMDAAGSSRAAILGIFWLHSRSTDLRHHSALATDARTGWSATTTKIGLV